MKWKRRVYAAQVRIPTLSAIDSLILLNDAMMFLAEA